MPSVVWVVLVKGMLLWMRVRSLFFGRIRRRVLTDEMSSSLKKSDINFSLADRALSLNNKQLPKQS